MQHNDTTEYNVQNGLIYKHHRLYIPPISVLTNIVLHDYHDSKLACHRGVDKTYDMIMQHYYWPKMYEYVQRYIQSCRVCQMNKSTNKLTPGLLKQRPAPVIITRNHNGFYSEITDYTQW